MTIVLKNVDDIAKFWIDDRLGRNREALLIESFVKEETRTWAQQGREQSYVLAIDAPYGVGKTFFLDRFRAQLAESHPVAYIDAWVDDANAEPLVAIMAAIEDALKPFINPRNNLGEKVKAVTRAALPIIGKAVVAGGVTALKRHFGADISELVKVEMDKATAKAVEDTVGDAADSVKDSVEALIDREAQEMIDAYKRRKSSRKDFKTSMAALVAEIGHSATDRFAPLFVVIDELDRCRPDYAIRVLEEIKHFFDVPGVVFVIALHSEQLTKSISAVYGSEFDSQAYLRRFFNRNYSLRQPTSVELVRELLTEAKLANARFTSPRVRNGTVVIEPGDISEFTANFLGDFGMTPRELRAAVDMMRVFMTFWVDDRPVELPLLLGLIIHRLRDLHWALNTIKPRGRLQFDQQGLEEKLDTDAFTADLLLQAYNNNIGQNLIDVKPEHHLSPQGYYVADYLRREMRARNPAGPIIHPKSALLAYEPLVNDIFPFSVEIARTVDGDNNMGKLGRDN